MDRIPGQLILFVGIMIAGIATHSIHRENTNIVAWAALVYAVASMVIGVAIVYR